MTEPNPTALPAAEPQPSAIRDLTTGSAGTLLLVILVFVCYAASIRGGYVWDDDAYVSGNPTMTSFAGLSRIWTDIGSTPQYYPLTFTSFWLEVRLFGFTPQISHFINVLLHTGSVLLLWKILRRLAVPGAWACAAVFAVHPINVESVAWIAERKNTLSMILALSATWTYLRYAHLGRAELATRPAGEGISVPLPDDPSRLYRLFLAFFVLALLAKTTVAVLPVILLVIVWWQRGRLTSRDVLPLLPTLVIGAIAAGVTGYVEHSPDFVGATGPQWDLSPLQRLLLIGQTNVFYAYKILWPFPIGVKSVTDANGSALATVWPWFPTSFNYYRWTIAPAAPLQWLPLAALVAALGGLALTVRRIGRGPLAAALVFVVGLLPACGIVSVYPMRYSWVADHFAYVGAVGLIVGVVAGLTRLLRRLPQASAGLAAVLLAGMVAVTLWHSWAFRSMKNLWEQTYQQNPRSWLASIQYGLIAMDRANDSYNTAMENGDDQKAVEDRNAARHAADLWFATALQQNPNAYEAYLSQGILAAQRGKPDEALDDYRKAEAAADRVGATYRKPAFAIGALLISQGKTQEGLAVLSDLEKVAADNPKLASRSSRLFADVHTLHGDVVRQSIKTPIKPGMGDADRAALQEAMDHYTSATEIDPDYVPAKIKLAAILVDTNFPAEALQQIGDVFRIDQNNADAKLLTAIVAEKQSQFEAAAAQLKNLIEVRPDMLTAHMELAKVLLTMGRVEEAVNELTTTTQHFPRSQDAKAMLEAIKSASTQPATRPIAAAATQATGATGAAGAVDPTRATTP